MVQLVLVILAAVVGSHAEVHPSSNNNVRPVNVASNSGIHQSASALANDLGALDNVAEPTLFRHEVSNVGPAVNRAFDGKSSPQQVSSLNGEKQLLSLPEFIQVPKRGFGPRQSHSVSVNSHTTEGGSYGHNKVPSISGLYSAPDVGVPHAGSFSSSHGQSHYADNSARNYGQSHHSDQSVRSYSQSQHSSQPVQSYGQSHQSDYSTSQISSHTVQSHGQSHLPHHSDNGIQNTYAAPHVGSTVPHQSSGYAAQPSLSYLPPAITASGSEINEVSHPVAVVAPISYSPVTENVLRPIPVLVDYPAPQGPYETNVNLDLVAPLPNLVGNLDYYAPSYPVPVQVDAVAPVLPISSVKSQYHAQDELGQYSFGYKTDESARDETRNAYGHVQGSYSYVDVNGDVQSQYYVADDKGFRVTGTNLPVHVTDTKH